MSLVTGETFDRPSQLGRGEILVAVEACDPLSHQVGHKLVVVFVDLCQRQPLLWDIFEIHLSRDMAVGTPDSAVDGI